MLTLCHICCKYFHPINFLLDLLWCFLFGPQNFFFGNGICHFFSYIISGFLFVVRPFLFQDCNIFLMSLLIFSLSASLYSSTSLLLLPGRDCSFNPSFCKWGSCTSVISQGHAPSFYGGAENRTQCSLCLNLSPLLFPVWWVNTGIECLLLALECLLLPPECWALRMQLWIEWAQHLASWNL